MNPWRLVILKSFGAKISGIPFVHSSARIQIPWNLILHHRACLGEGVTAYSLGEIEIQEGGTVAQEAYLCTGTHDFERASLQLITKRILIESNVFIGARAMILPGVTIGKNAVIGAMAVVAKDIEVNEIIAGTPSRKIGERSRIQ